MRPGLIGLGGQALQQGAGFLELALAGQQGCAPGLGAEKLLAVFDALQPLLSRRMVPAYFRDLSMQQVGLRQAGTQRFIVRR
jgi:hypothetical protein